jgi:hypothetical protein
VSPEEVTALLVLMTAIITVVWILAGTCKRHLAFQERKLEIMAGQTAEKAAQYAAQNARLENRVRVLECIATEDGNDLATQIEALRGTEPVEVTRQ